MTSFTFELVSPERLVLSAQVTEAIVPGITGDFTMLAGHAPFITTLKPGVVTVTDAAGKHRRFYVRGGIADAGPTGLTVLADKAMPAGDAKGDVAAAEIAYAEAELARAPDDVVRAAAAQRLADLRLALAAAAAAVASTH